MKFDEVRTFLANESPAGVLQNRFEDVSTIALVQKFNLVTVIGSYRGSSHVDENWPTVNNCSLRTMYRRPKFLEVLLEIRREMALEADYDVDLFAEIARSGNRSAKAKRYRLEPVSPDPPVEEEEITKLRNSRGA